MMPFKRENPTEPDIPELSYAEASARVQPIRDQVVQVAAEKVAAIRAMEEHECKAVLAATDIDPSFRQRFRELESREGELRHTLRLLEGRLETVREAEAAGERQARREAAERLHTQLLQQHNEVCRKAVSAVLAAHAGFAELARLKRSIEAHLDQELQGSGKRGPNDLPGHIFNLRDHQSMVGWVDDLCALGYADLIPDSHPAKARFLNLQRTRAASVLVGQV